MNVDKHRVLEDAGAILSYVIVATGFSPGVGLIVMIGWFVARRIADRG